MDPIIEMLLDREVPVYSLLLLCGGLGLFIHSFMYKQNLGSFQSIGLNNCNIVTLSSLEEES